MKVEIFKKNFESYKCIQHRTHNPIDTISKYKREKVGSSFNFDEDLEFLLVDPPTTKRPLFLIEKTTTDSETYLENFKNTMCTINKRHTMVVVEKTGDKVSLKLFYGNRDRKVGKSWFKVSWNVEYITVNTKTGDVYIGYLREYQKKRKCLKKVRRNLFIDNPISRLRLMIKNQITGYGDCDDNNPFDVATNAVSAFLFEIDGRDDFEGLDFNERLFKFYLTKRQIRYPNNFYAYSQHLIGPEIRKELKKNGNKLVDAFMSKQNLSGKKLKKSLHICRGLNISLYQYARSIFGDDWLNQDGDVITDLLNSYHSGNHSLVDNFKLFVSPDELKRVYTIFKKVYIEGLMDSWTFSDHMRMYTELKMFGERDLRWLSELNKSEFTQEHLDWTDKIQFYRQGSYQRIYPTYFVDNIQTKIDGYSPVLLIGSNDYNEESSTQSNCVKTYVSKSSSFIISIRNDSNKERATIEYNLTKKDGKIVPTRIQSLGRFNHRLTEEWNDILFKLDKVVLSSIKDKRFETVKIKKECKNGVVLTSDSLWEEDNLRWSNKSIGGASSSFDDIFNDF